LKYRIQVAFLVGQHLTDDEIATYLNGNHAQIRGSNQKSYVISNIHLINSIKS
jgi:hypothetical protein